MAYKANWLVSEQYKKKSSDHFSWKTRHSLSIFLNLLLEGPAPAIVESAYIENTLSLEMDINQSQMNVGRAVRFSGLLEWMTHLPTAETKMSCTVRGIMRLHCVFVQKPLIGET